MERHYSPPIPARLGNAENPSYRLLVADYLAALKDFSDPDLEVGMRALVEAWKYARWPKPGEVVPFMREAQAMSRKPLAVRPVSRGGYWDAVKSRRDDFVNNFMAGTLGKEAAANGWQDQLRDYVRKVAWYQAQIVERCARSGKAFACRAKNRDGWRIYPDDYIRFYQLEDLERYGEMTLSVPTEELDAIKQRAVQQAAFAKQKTPVGSAIPVGNVSTAA